MIPVLPGNRYIIRWTKSEKCLEFFSHFTHLCLPTYRHLKKLITRTVPYKFGSDRSVLRKLWNLLDCRTEEMLNFQCFFRFQRKGDVFSRFPIYTLTLSAKWRNHFRNKKKTHLCTEGVFCTYHSLPVKNEKLQNFEIRLARKK